MYRLPSARVRKKGAQRLNLVPILDVVFILIFFLLLSAEFIKVYEIGSDLPILSQAPPPPKQKKEPLNLTAKVTRKFITLFSGDTVRLKKFPRRQDKEEDLENETEREDVFDKEELHQYLISLKASYPEENNIIIQADVGTSYFFLVELMDQVRYQKKMTEEGESKEEPLFNQIIFGDLME